MRRPDRNFRFPRIFHILVVRSFWERLTADVFGSNTNVAVVALQQGIFPKSRQNIIYDTDGKLYNTNSFFLYRSLWNLTPIQQTHVNELPYLRVVFCCFGDWIFISPTFAKLVFSFSSRTYSFFVRLSVCSCFSYLLCRGLSFLGLLSTGFLRWILSSHLPITEWLISVNDWINIGFESHTHTRIHTHTHTPTIERSIKFDRLFAPLRMGLLGLY